MPVKKIVKFDPFSFVTPQEIRNVAKLLINFNSGEMSAEGATREAYFKSVVAVLATSLATAGNKKAIASLEYKIATAQWSGQEALIVALTMRLVKKANRSGKKLSLPKKNVETTPVFSKDEWEDIFEAAPEISAADKLARDKKNQTARSASAKNRQEALL